MPSQTRSPTMLAHVSTVVAFGPNTAIQTQWANAWNELGADRAGLDRDLSTRFTALTYQSLAVFDDDRDATTSLLDELAPGGRELVDRLGDGGPVLLILDECHHLLDVWGNLLAELLDLLPGVWVLGLTATPPETMTAAQSELVSGLFSDIRYSASIPAVVREGDLAPFADLVWVTTPTSEENSWLSGQAVRFTELITGILDPIPWVGLGLILLVIGVALGGVGGTTLTVLGLLLLASLPVMLSAAGARQARLYARPPTVGQLADTIAEALRETGKTIRSGTRCPRC